MNAFTWNYIFKKGLLLWFKMLAMPSFRPNKPIKIYFNLIGSTLLYTIYVKDTLIF